MLSHNYFFFFFFFFSLLPLPHQTSCVWLALAGQRAQPAGAEPSLKLAGRIFPWGLAGAGGDSVAWGSTLQPALLPLRCPSRDAECEHPRHLLCAVGIGSKANPWEMRVLQEGWEVPIFPQVSSCLLEKGQNNTSSVLPHRQLQGLFGLYVSSC